LVFLHKSGETIELGGPEALVMREPVHRFLHRLRAELARNGAAGFCARDQSGIRKHIEVLHDCRQ